MEPTWRCALEGLDLEAEIGGDISPSLGRYPQARGGLLASLGSFFVHSIPVDASYRRLERLAPSFLPTARPWEGISVSSGVVRRCHLCSDKTWTRTYHGLRDDVDFLHSILLNSSRYVHPEKSHSLALKKWAKKSRLGKRARPGGQTRHPQLTSKMFPVPQLSSPRSHGGTPSKSLGQPHKLSSLR